MAETTDLQRAFEALSGKQAVYDALWKYYDGDHPLVYSTQRLRKIFRRLDASFVENWCAVVVDGALERIQLERLTVANDAKASGRLGALWKSTQLDLDADDAHLAALVTGEAFVIAWTVRAGEDDGPGEIQAYYNDPRLCHVQYNAENPRVADWAAKWWKDDVGRYRLTLYYADRLEYYVTKAGVSKVENYKAFAPADPDQAPNPFGVIPVFHFQRERRKIASELANVVPLQAAVNKLLADMMVSAEFGAFKQRYIISNAEVATLKNAPGEIWDVPAGDGSGQATSVGELSATELANFSGAITNLVGAISAISRTPHHYFFHDSGGVPSGEALIALEAPLNKKCGRYIRRFGNTWQRVAAFLLLLDGKKVDPETITPVFEDPATVQPRTRAEVREIRVRAGEPLTTVLRDQGMSDAYIEQMRDDRQIEQADAQNSLARALLAQQRQFDQEGTNEQT